MNSYYNNVIKAKAHLQILMSNDATSNSQMTAYYMGKVDAYTESIIHYTTKQLKKAVVGKKVD